MDIGNKVGFLFVSFTKENPNMVQFTLLEISDKANFIHKSLMSNKLL